ncbi:hypothetical protein [Acinetobacter sp. H1(2024)]|uniref:hypothetical protein n=1 Tax=Acinetobacter sp. H1(2024) TaxID=3390190 RepID=UPI00397AF181
MKNLVLYRERYYQDQPLNKPSIEDNKFKLSESLANEIVAYLESGSTILEFVSPTTDPYDSADHIPNIILTDGVYVWDAIIINWLKKYRVRLPNEFLIHYENMKNKNIGSIFLPDDILEQLKDAEDVFL